MAIGPRPGDLRDRIREEQKLWVGLLAENAERAREAGELDAADPDQLDSPAGSAALAPAASPPRVLALRASIAYAPAMSSFVLLRWTVPVSARGSSRASLVRRVSPALRAAGWLCSPDTSHFLRNQGREVWVTVTAPIDDVTNIRDELTELLTLPPTVETIQDPILANGAAWYRVVLQSVTHVALDVLEVDGRIPVDEYEAFESPSEGAPRLVRGPAPELAPAGRYLWNLAG